MDGMVMERRRAMMKRPSDYRCVGARRGEFGGAWAGVIACAVIGAAACVLGGCSKPLLAPTDVRSPFDRYDAVRSQYAQQYVEDKFGRRQPNLRARLAPKD